MKADMEETWYDIDSTFEKIILSGDVGGSNTNLAIVAFSRGTHKKIAEFRFESRKITDFSDAVEKVVSAVKEKGRHLVPNICCISAAGPVQENKSNPTNLKWIVDGAQIQEKYGIPTLVINDFQALAFGLPLLDTENPAQVIKVPHPQGRVPESSGASWAVAGAGTGLGIGYLTNRNGHYVSIPSEGGHSGFCAFDDETFSLKDYITSNTGSIPGTELFLSGRGMASIFNFFRDIKGMKLDGLLAEIDAVPDIDKPPLITKYTQAVPELKSIMKLFIKIYGQVASNVALFFLPTSGMFIAGGIVIRHSQLFLEDDLFITYFRQNYNSKIRELLSSIPVFIVNDYSISLTGSANAAISLLGTK
jgi:glucokinase